MTKADQRAFKEHWGTDQVQAFGAAKTMGAHDALLSHPDPMKSLSLRQALLIVRLEQQ